MFSCLQILEAFLWFVLITLLNVTLIILTLSVSRLLNLLLRLVAFLLFLNLQSLAPIGRWITASSSWKRFCVFVCRALSSIMVICMLTAIRLLLTFVMSLYLLLRSYCFFQAKDGIRYVAVTGVQTCALPISATPRRSPPPARASAGSTSLSRGLPRWGGRGSAACRAPPRSRSPLRSRRSARARSTRPASRSEERRVGKECRFGGWPII